jgi:hypothetical protein
LPIENFQLAIFNQLKPELKPRAPSVRRALHLIPE